MQVGYSQKESNTIEEYLDFYRDEFRTNMPDYYYINHSRWKELRERGERIVTRMEANQKKYDVESDQEDY